MTSTETAMPFSFPNSQLDRSLTVAARSISHFVVPLAAATLLTVTGCAAPHHSIASILKRQTVALAELPAEDRRRLMPRDEPSESGKPETPVVPEVLTLSDARRIALQANPDIHAAQARLEAALARIGEARAAYFPTIGAVHNSTRNFQTPQSRNPLIRPFTQQPWENIFTSLTADQQPDVGTMFSTLTSGLFGTPGYGGSNANSFSQHSSMLTVAWTLFDGFAREARLMGTKHNYRATAMALADVERLVVHAVDAAYLQVLLGRERLRIAMADEQFSREQLALAEKNRDSGKGTEADVLNFRVRVRAAQADITAARGILNTGRVVLAELMGLPDAHLPDHVDSPPLADESELALTAPDEDQWLKHAARSRPDLAQQQHQAHAAAENVRIAKGSFSPAVTLSGSYGFEKRGNMGFGDEDQASAAGIEVSWQLFTGGFRTSQLRRVRQEQREAIAKLERARLAVASDVRQSIISLVNAQEEVKLHCLALEAARENRRIIKAQYAEGKTSLVRLNEAQRDYVQTDVELTAARIRLRQAWSDLHAATASYADGLSWEDFDVQPPMH